MGPDTYDLVSLLRDSYVDLGNDSVDDYLAYFLALRASWRGAAVSAAGFDSDGAAAQPQSARHLRVSDDRTAQPRVHPVHSRRTLRAARENLVKYPRFARLHEILSAHIPELA